MIRKAVRKFQLDLKGKLVLTEAASGNFICTPLIALESGATVFALGRDSQYGKYEEIVKKIKKTERQLDKENSIRFLRGTNEINLSRVDVVTNNGFLRPINRAFIDKLNNSCVIPLMYEPWEFRSSDIDLEYCFSKCIKVYGTNESDPRLMTMDYIGYTVLYFLLKGKKTPQSSKILMIGSDRFNQAVHKILSALNYDITTFAAGSRSFEFNASDYDVIVFTEFVQDTQLLGSKPEALIQKSQIRKDHLIIHIAGNIDAKDLKCKIFPSRPAPANYMSFTTDFIDPNAVVDLHCAGLKVAEGMMKANEMLLKGTDYKEFMERNYPALAFEDIKFW